METRNLRGRNGADDKDIREEARKGERERKPGGHTESALLTPPFTLDGGFECMQVKLDKPRHRFDP